MGLHELMHPALAGVHFLALQPTADPDGDPIGRFKIYKNCHRNIPPL